MIIKIDYTFNNRIGSVTTKNMREFVSNMMALKKLNANISFEVLSNCEDIN